MDAKALAHPSVHTGARQWGKGSVWPLIASIEYTCMCASQNHTCILLHRKGNRHTRVCTHTDRLRLPYLCNWHGGSERQAWIIVAGGHNLFAAPFPSSSFFLFPHRPLLRHHNYTRSHTVPYSYTNSTTSRLFCHCL